MKLWKISQNINNGYDTYDSAVVAAETEEDARNTSPAGYSSPYAYRMWAYPEDVLVEYLGTTDRDLPNKTIIVKSFNAG